MRYDLPHSPKPSEGVFIKSNAMNGIAMKPAADVNPEPEIMLASPIEACPVLPNHAQLAESALMGARSLALTIVATIAVVFSLQWAEKFLITLLLGRTATAG